jgi:hypothetical protein
VSFDPRLPEDLQLFIVRFNRDDARLDEMRLGVEKFLSEVNVVIEKLNQLRGKKCL